VCVYGWLVHVPGTAVQRVCACASRLLVRTMVEVVGGERRGDDLQRLYGSCRVAAVLAVRKRPPRYSIAHGGLEELTSVADTL